mmetsp:Transcript_5761/g.14387  ORF Transcript_5761/g.14387 Transcript_5761/m.14387 type:complete len:299 (-) Transcript_5761:288-1184(-)
MPIPTIPFRSGRRIRILIELVRIGREQAGVGLAGRLVLQCPFPCHRLSDEVLPRHFFLVRAVPEHDIVLDVPDAPPPPAIVRRREPRARIQDGTAVVRATPPIIANEDLDELARDAVHAPLVVVHGRFRAHALGHDARRTHREDPIVAHDAIMGAFLLAQEQRRGGGEIRAEDGHEGVTVPRHDRGLDAVDGGSVVRRAGARRVTSSIAVVVPPEGKVAVRADDGPAAPAVPSSREQLHLVQYLPDVAPQRLRDRRQPPPHNLATAPVVVVFVVEQPHSLALRDLGHPGGALPGTRTR